MQSDLELDTETASIPPEFVDRDLRSAWIAAIRYFGVLPRGDGEAPPQVVDDESASDQSLRRHVA